MLRSGGQGSEGETRVHSSPWEEGEVQILQ